MEYLAKPVLGFLGGAVLFLFAVGPKSLPLVYTIRLLPSLYRLLQPRFSRELAIKQSQSPSNKTVLFTLYITLSRAGLADLDLNLHKSNSTFFSDADINRAELVTRRLAGGLARVKAVPVLAAVQARFQREVPPFGAYEVASRILAWDEKGLFVVTYFVKCGTRFPEAEVEGGPGAVMADASVRRSVFATIVSRYVCKKGRETVPPRQVIEAAGLLGEDSKGGVVEKAVENGLKYVREAMF